MIVKVTRRFRDKYTGEIYLKGNLLEITKERYDEIMSVGNFVYQIEQKDAEDVSADSAKSLSNEAAETPTNEPDAPSDGFDIMSVRELKEYADQTHKLTFKAGTKRAEIIETLRRMEHGK